MLAPVYALAEGLFLGGISASFESYIQALSFRLWEEHLAHLRASLVLSIRLNQSN